MCQSLHSQPPLTTPPQIHTLVIVRLQMAALCGNVLELEDGRGLPVLAMSTQAYNAFTEDQRQLMRCGARLHARVCVWWRGCKFASALPLMGRAFPHSCLTGCCAPVVPPTFPGGTWRRCTTPPSTPWSTSVAAACAAPWQRSSEAPPEGRHPGIPAVER